ncbi:MAG: hypothetical protein WC661_17440 [Opitutaceae bacterium]
MTFPRLKAAAQSTQPASQCPHSSATASGGNKISELAAAATDKIPSQNTGSTRRTNGHWHAFLFDGSAFGELSTNARWALTMSS